MNKTKEQWRNKKLLNDEKYLSMVTADGEGRGGFDREVRLCFALDSSSHTPFLRLSRMLQQNELMRSFIPTWLPGRFKFNWGRPEKKVGFILYLDNEHDSTCDSVRGIFMSLGAGEVMK